MGSRAVGLGVRGLRVQGLGLRGLGFRLIQVFRIEGLSLLRKFLYDPA